MSALSNNKDNLLEHIDVSALSAVILKITHRNILTCFTLWVGKVAVQQVPHSVLRYLESGGQNLSLHLMNLCFQKVRTPVSSQYGEHKC